MTSGSPELHLSPDQQDLLLAALNSNAPSSMYLSQSLPDQLHPHDHHHQQQQQHSPYEYTASQFGGADRIIDHKFSLSDLAAASSGPNEMDMARTNSLTTFGDSGSTHDTPVIGELVFPFDLDGNFEYDLGFPGYGDIGTNTSVTTLDGSVNAPSPLVEHEKRKSPPTDEGTPGAQESGNKKRGKDNGEEKIPKKPGRKPLTSEPTSKRKAQNRAAQRAFRERKEKHLKDLEDKVAELQQASESANKENSMLRAQIERLQAELAEYRKRLNDTKVGFSSVLGKGSNGGFQFEFPMFGLHNKNVTDANGLALNGGIKVGPGTLLERQPPLISTRSFQLSDSRPSTSDTRRNSNSPPTTMRSVSTTYSSLFSPTLPSTIQELPLELTPKDLTGYGEGHSGSRQHTPSSVKLDSTSSPSASTVSQHGAASSCVTSPESMSHSPSQFKPHESIESVTDEIQVVSSDHDEPGFYCDVLDDGETSFCEKLGAIACGNPRNPMPLPPDSKRLPNLNEVIPRPDPASIARRSGKNTTGISSIHDTGSFESSAFTDYRDPLKDIDISFFDRTFPMAGFAVGSPVRPGSPAPERAYEAAVEPVKPPAAGLKDTDEDSDDDDDGVIIGSNNDSTMMPCHQIWDRIQTHPKFVSGELDIDRLCKDLHSKARCSELGVVVGAKDLEEALSNAGCKGELMNQS